MKSFDNIKARESGLRNALSEGQMSMIAIGGAIGTGLFLGSKLAISFAGPSVILSYVISGLAALCLMGCLVEMTVQHHTSGSFGAYAEHYMGPAMGFILRYCYVSGIIMAVGSEVIAIGEYMKFWFPTVEPVIWQILFSAVLIGANLTSVKAFGSMEWVFSMLKVFVIVAFLIVGAGYLFLSQDTQQIKEHLWANGGFFPQGFKGTWFGAVVAVFSYFGLEFIAVAAGEATAPEKSIRKAFKSTMVRLLVFYLLTLSLIIMMVPWQRLIEKDAPSPFVMVMNDIHLPFADSILNVVVIVASLSAMNGMLYIASRMLFSLSRSGDAPKSLGKVSVTGVPVNSLLLSVIGIAVAVIVSRLSPDTAFPIMIALTMFGLLFTWFMIFVTHIFFRRAMARQQIVLKYKIQGYPVGTVLGMIIVGAIIVSTWFAEDFHATLVFGVPYLLVLTVVYYGRQYYRSRHRG